MSKTERILSFLPSTFQTEPTTNVYWLADVFGQRLEEIESLLVSLMKAHWIDFADRGADTILDLARIAGLANLYVYYLNPACDPTSLILPVLRRKQEGGREIPWDEYAAAGRKIVWERHEVERFRSFLKRFIRTYLEGPSTIQGLLRVTADTLVVEIDDKNLVRFTPFLTGAPLTSDEAAPALFGADVWDPDEHHMSRGQDAAPASFTGTQDLSGGVILNGNRYVKLSIDGAAPDLIDLEGVTDIQGAVDKLQTAFGERAIVSHDEHLITVTGMKLGREGCVEVQVPEEANATFHLFGSALPQTVHGQDAKAASLRGLPLDIRNDLGQRRFLTIAIDGAPAREVDCAGDYPEATSQEEITQAINTVFSDFGKPVADLTTDGRLRLTSPSLGARSTIELQPRYLRLQESPPVAQFWKTPEPIADGSDFPVVNRSVVEEPIIEVVVHAVKGIIGPGFRDATTGACLRAHVALMMGDVLHLQRDRSGAWVGWVEESDVPVEVVSSQPGMSLYLRRGASRWWFTECQGARFDAARFNDDHFVGPPCEITGVFDATAFDAALPGEVTVFASRAAPMPEPVADIAFHFDLHPPATFEIQLPAALPPRHGALFDHARFAVAPEAYCQVTVFPVDDPNSLVTKITAESALVSATTAAPPAQPTLLPGAKPSDGVEVLFFEGGSDATEEEAAQPASLVLYADGWEQAIKLEARRPGEWGNSLAFEASAILAGGSFNATIALAGAPAVFENARQMVWEAAVEAKAAGVQLDQVIRSQPLI